MIKPIFITLLLIHTAFIGSAVAQSSAIPDGAVDLPLRTDQGDGFGLLAIDGGMIENETLSGSLLSDSLISDPGLLSCDAPATACDMCDAGCRDICACHFGSGQGVASHWTPWIGFRDRFAAINLDRFNVSARFRDHRTRDRGIGYERVMYAPSVLDTAIQVPHVGFRYQLDYGLDVPDRAEYFWGAPSSVASDSVNTQDLSARLVVGNEKAVALTQYTLRSLDPVSRRNTTGMGDMIVGAQGTIVDGKRTKLATILRTYIATGSSSKGLGTGHTSLEYGLLGRQCVSPETYLFGELKYWMPIGGTSGVSGDVLSTGWGISTIASESDVFAFLPTFEMRTLSFLFGGQTLPGATSRTAIDGDTVVELYPGARFVFDRQSDLGLVEFGMSAGITVADDEWFDTRWVFDLRFSR